jgi:predicted PurR-regulated permease PerM
MADVGRAQAVRQAERPPPRVPDRLPPPYRRREHVPVRTILTTIGLVVATMLVLLVMRATARVLTWIVIAAFFAVALYPAVDWVQNHVRRCPRSLATLSVFLLALTAVVGTIAGLVLPLAHESGNVVAGVQQMIDDARTGRGATGDLLNRMHAADWVRQHQDELNRLAAGVGGSALGFVRGAAGGIVAAFTIITMSFLMVLEGPRIIETTLGLVRPASRDRVRRVGADCAKAITGYIAGNVAISIICGSLTFAVLTFCGVPFAGVIALWVGITDLIPMIGATLGGVVAGGAGFLHSTGAGITVVVFFVLYQQFENHVLQPLIMSRAVKQNPLTVLIAILVLGQLGGILGALLAVPIAGIAQVLLTDWWRHRGGTPAPSAAVRG